MFDIGFLELVLIAIIALLVLGPERLPVAARAAGRWVGKARRMVTQFSREVDRQLEIEELRKKLKEQGESLDVTEDAKQIYRTVQEALDEAKTNPGYDPYQDVHPDQHHLLDENDGHYPHQDKPHGDFEPLPREDNDASNTIHTPDQTTASNNNK